MEYNDLVSIIVPCYNQQNYIKDTLLSVINQTYQNWECIIVNDGSTDNSLDIILPFTEMDNRITVLNQDNQGLANSRNNGIKKSNGKYILALDSDDIISPTYIEEIISAFNFDSELKVVYTLADRFGYYREKWYLPEYSYEMELFQNCIYCSAIYKRVDYEKTQGYNSNMKFGYEDWDFWLSLLNENDKVLCINKCLFHYRSKKESMLINADKRKELILQQLYINHLDKYSKYLNSFIFYKKNSDNFEKFKNKRIIKFLLGINIPISIIKRKIKNFIYILKEGKYPK